LCLYCLYSVFYLALCE